MKQTVVFIVIVLFSFSFCFSQTRQAKIIVHPNIQVSKDGNFVHGEYMLAINPKDPNNLLIGSAILPIDDTSNVAIYLSKNGGKTWEEGINNFPEIKGFSNYDSQVEFGLQGTAYFMVLSTLENMQTCLYRSEDGGANWRKPVILVDNLYGLPKTFDHEQIAADKTFGKYAGNVYISAMHDIPNVFPGEKQWKNQYSVWFFRSIDDGKSFIGPLKIASAQKGKGMNTNNLLISSSGIIFYPYVEWFNDHSLPNNFYGYDMFMCSSLDGGVTFSSPRQISRMRQDTSSYALGYILNYSTFPQYAIDNKTEKFKNRLYCVFTDEEDKKVRLKFIFSKDNGESWSNPKLVDINTPEGAQQYQPSITVNSAGIVGIRWFDTRGVIFGKEYNEYFTASLDGGETFLSPVKVSSETSKVFDDSGELVIPIWSRTPNKDSIILKFKKEGEGRYANGGDYIQFTADANGAFHDIWAGSLNGRGYQIYTSKIEVGDTSSSTTLSKTEIENKNVDIIPSDKNLNSISDLISLQIDPVIYDSIHERLAIPIRVKNTSNKIIYGPITIEVVKIDTSLRIGLGLDQYHYNNTIPLITNSTNKKKGKGATFKYTLTNNVLMPGMETETMVWEFHVKVPYKMWRMTDAQKKYWKTDQEYSNEGLYPKYLSHLYLKAAGYLGKEL